MAEGPRGALLVVATPIGNLGDVTARALASLRDADAIAAEDTRRTRQLLTHFGISGKELVRLDEHAPPHVITGLADRVAAGELVALVSDAGTPLVSDPGASLVRAVIEKGARVVPVPGASAVLAAAAASGLVPGAFRFVGFLPRGGPERGLALAACARDQDSVVLFESPQRLAGTLEDLAARAPEREACVARELTKLHEEFVRGPLRELAELAKAREWLGEIVLVLGPHAAAREVYDDARLDARLDEELAKGRRLKEIAAELAVEAGRPTREVYTRGLARRREG